MKKIEPMAFYFKTEYSCGLEWTKIGKSTNPLYAIEALEAAVNAAVEECELVTGARFTIDIAAIINKLTGE